MVFWPEVDAISWTAVVACCRGGEGTEGYARSIFPPVQRLVGLRQEPGEAPRCVLPSDLKGVVPAGSELMS